MLSEAQALGTNVIYLNDYWEAVSPPLAPITTCPDVLSGMRAPYFCKGDYFIRQDHDLGGLPSLKAGIADVHNRGGRVILYLEPFVVHKNSAVGNAHGELWGGQFPWTNSVWVPFAPDPDFTENDPANPVLLTSPIRYGLPQVNVFSNGTNVNELNQVYALGHNLALCSNWGPSWIRDNAAYIQKLVQIRKNLASALIHGAQTFQIDLQGINGNAVAYGYIGRPNVVTVLNSNRDGIMFEGDIPVNTLMAPNRRGKIKSAEMFSKSPGRDCP